MDLSTLEIPYLGTLFSDKESDLRNSFPGYTLRVMSKDSFCTLDYNSERINVYLDDEGKIRRLSIG